MKNIGFRLRSLRSDVRGASTIEFALWVVFILSALLLSADFGLYALHKGRLERSVAEASMHAHNTRAAINAEDIRQVVLRSSSLPGSPPTVTVRCNGSSECVNSTRPCACMDSAGVVGSAIACTETCATGAKPGYYLTVQANYVYSASVIGNSPIKDKGMSLVSTVRLQ